MVERQHEYFALMFRQLGERLTDGSRGDFTFSRLLRAGISACQTFSVIQWHIVRLELSLCVHSSIPCDHEQPCIDTAFAPELASMIPDCQHDILQDLFRLLPIPQPCHQITEQGWPKARIQLLQRLPIT